VFPLLFPDNGKTDLFRTQISDPAAQYFYEKEACYFVSLHREVVPGNGWRQSFS
jgi:hypothetical protein